MNDAMDILADARTVRQRGTLSPIVMAGLDPAIHTFQKRWMPGSRPGRPRRTRLWLGGAFELRPILYHCLLVGDGVGHDLFAPGGAARKARDLFLCRGVPPAGGVTMGRGCDPAKPRGKTRQALTLGLASTYRQLVV